MRRLRSLPTLVAYLAFQLFYAENAIGQCAGIRVQHTSGTETVGCTDVTVTSDGSVGSSYPTPCAYGPYLIGPNGNGSYTFDFSTPIQGALIDIQTLDNHSGNIEEMVVEVNGVFYPIPSAGNADGCWEHAIVWPPGTIRGQVGGHGSARDIYISGSINTLKITNNWVEGMPIGFTASVYLCCATCNTEAGTINVGPVQVCQTDPIVLPSAEQTSLDPDDLLQYVLYTNNINMAGSIIASNSSPQFSFDPVNMVAGVTYYVSAIAGNNLNGNVDLNDPCLDISNTIEVVWMPIPVVTFFSSVSCLKPGECYDIVINFLGEFPIQMTGQVVIGGNVVTTFGGTYTASTAVQQVCIPVSAPLGPITIEATSLSDVFCTCN